MVTNNGHPGLTNNFYGRRYLRAVSNSWVDLGYTNLTVRTRRHVIGPGSSTNVLNYGAIFWIPDVGGAHDVCSIRKWTEEL